MPEVDDWTAAAAPPAARPGGDDWTTSERSPQPPDDKALPEAFVDRILDGQLADQPFNPLERLLGLRGAQRFKTWPEKAIAAAGSLLNRGIDTAEGFFPTAEAIKSGVTAPGDALSGRMQVIDPETGMPSSEALSRANDAAQLMLGSTVFHRVTRGLTGEFTTEPLGRPPKTEDFQNATTVMVNGEDVSPAVKAKIAEKLDTLYQDHGIHPAEAVQDAERDPLVAQSMLSSGDDLPERYAGPMPLSAGVKAQGLDAADAIKRQWAAQSPIKTIDDLFAHAQENQDSLASAGQQIADDLGIEFKNPGIKGQPRTQEKIEGGKAPGRINDVVRGGFVVETPAQGDAIVKGLAAKFEVADEGWFVTPAGYFDRKVIVRFPNGQGGEIQIWHPEMFKAKKGEGQRLYTQSRSLRPDDPQLAELDAAQKKLYEAALAGAAPEWKALLGSGGTDGNLASNAALESTRPSMPISDELARVQESEPSRNTQASPGTQANGSPSTDPNLISGEVKRTSDTNNLGGTESERNPVAGQDLAVIEGAGRGPPGPPGSTNLTAPPAGRPGPGSFEDAQRRILDKISVGEPDAQRRWTFGRIYTAVIDKLYPLNRAVERAAGADLPSADNPYHLARLMAGVAGKADHFLKHGTFDFNTYEVNGPSLEAILEPVSGDLQGFRAFAAAARAEELERRGIRSGFDRDAVQTVGAAGMQNPVYMETLEKLIGYQNKLAAYLRDAGVLSAGAHDAMIDANRLYIPFNRVMGDVETGLRGLGGSLESRNPIRAIKGSERDIVDPIENIVRNTYVFTQLAEKNAVGVKLIDMLERAAGEQEAGASRPPETLPARVDQATHQALTEWIEGQGGRAPEDLVSALEAIGAPPAREGEIAVFRNGRRTIYRVDPDLARAMKGLDAESANLIVRLFSMPANTLRAGAVATPDFALRHSIRDYLYAAITTKEGFFSPIDMARGFIGLITKDEDFWNWMKGGGGNVSMVSLDRRYLQENLGKLTQETGLATRAWNVVIDPNASWLQKGGAVLGLPFKAVSKYVIHPLQVLTELAESASHLGAFKKEMRAGETPPPLALPPGPRTTLPEVIQQPNLPALPGGASSAAPTKEAIQGAAWVSRDTAVDASRIGASTRAYNMLTAFANITLQDSDRIVRAFKTDPAGTALKVGGAIMLPSALLWWANHDDPRYQEVPQWQKDLFWIVLTKDHIFRIPKPFGVGQLFGSGTERTLEALRQQNPEAYRNWSKSIADAIVPQFLPTAGMPIVEQFANRSTFINRTLIPSDLEKQLPEYQYTPYTTELTKAVGRMISSFPGVRDKAIEPEALGTGPAKAISSPILIENYIRGWSGTLGMYALNAADLALRKTGALPDPPKPAGTLSDLPIIKAFVIRYPTATAQSIQDFEDRYATNKRFYDTWMAKAKDGDAEAMDRISKAGGPRMFVQLDSIKQVLSEHSQLIRDVYKDPKSSPAEKRQLIDQLYSNMIKVGQFGKKAMNDLDAGLGLQ